MLIAIAATTIADVRKADACSSSCWPGTFVPTEGATVPANVPALVWGPTLVNGGPDITYVTLTRDDGVGNPVVVPFTATQDPAGYFLLVPSEPLVVGATYTLVDDSPCDIFPTPRATFTVGPSAPLPTRLGTLTAAVEAQAQRTLATASGSCSVEAIVAGVEIAVVFDAEAAPWRDVLHFETRVDGNPWHPQGNILLAPAPGASWVGRGVDRIYAVCQNLDNFGFPSLDLPQGGHEVEMRATMPGTSLALSAGPVPAFLACAPLLDAGHSDGDAQLGPDAGSSVIDGDGGCGCGSSGGGSASWLGLALAALLFRTPRARRGRAGTAAR